MWLCSKRRVAGKGTLYCFSFASVAKPRGLGGDGGRLREAWSEFPEGARLRKVDFVVFFLRMWRSHGLIGDGERIS